jgi:hypothetical protein
MSATTDRSLDATLGYFVEWLSQPNEGRIRSRNEWPRVISLQVPNNAKSSDRWLSLNPVCHESHRRANWSGAQCSHEFYLALGLPDSAFDQLITALRTISKFKIN